jgi:hypothetical protein
MTSASANAGVMSGSDRMFQMEHAGHIRAHEAMRPVNVVAEVGF